MTPSPKANSPPDSSRSLTRGLTLVPAAAIVVTNMIGTGVFMKARVMTCNVGTPWLVLLAYALAGVFTIAGALTFAELSAMLPRAGGMYNFIGTAFGRLWAFLYGWMETFIDGAGGSAALAIVFATFFGDIIGGALSPSDAQALTIATLLAVIALTLASVRANGQLATFVTALKVLLVAGIGVTAFLLGDGSWDHFTVSGAAATCDDVAPSARFGLVGFGAAVVGALWSYNGWAAVSFMAEEVREPGRTLPRALIGGTGLVMGLYVLVNGGYFYVLSPEAIASVPETASVAGEVLVRLIGATGAALMSAGLMLSSFGALHSTVLTTSRLPFAMARDGLLPKSLGAVSPRARVPTRAVLLVGVCAIGFTLTGTFDLLTDLIVFALLVFNGLAVAAVYVLRRTLPNAPRPYRVWGYPIVPALYIGATLFLILNTLFATPGRALAGVAIVALGWPVYAHYARRGARSLPVEREPLL